MPVMMKRSLHIIVLAGMICVGLHAQSQPWCTPQTGQEQVTLSPCSDTDETLWTNLKRASWLVTWPDGASSNQANFGNGACRGNLSCTFADRVDCWALFDAPVNSPNYWSQTVTDQEADWAQGSHTCPAPYNNSTGTNIVCGGTGVIRTAVQNHNCTSGGGSCPAFCDPLSEPPGDGPTVCAYDICLYSLTNGCPDGDWTADNLCCHFGISPVILDLGGDGFALTNVQHGVDFDFYGTGHKIRISWTAPGSNDAWLVLDRNGNGVIDNAAEMFGNLTAQPPSSSPNGFLALGQFDAPEAGGNGDGILDSRDTVFSQLRLWQDKNHDGISQPEELLTLPTAGIVSIALGYDTMRFTDSYGNQFRYRSRVKHTPGRHVGPSAFDVILKATN